MSKIPEVQQNAELLENIRLIIKQCPHISFERALGVAKMSQNKERATNLQPTKENRQITNE
jgi:hypothetical protein